MCIPSLILFLKAITLRLTGSPVFQSNVLNISDSVPIFEKSEMWKGILII